MFSQVENLSPEIQEREAVCILNVLQDKPAAVS